MRALVTIALLSAACGANETFPRATVDPFRAGGEQPLACVPNLDGRIEAAELPVAFDVAAQYATSSEPRGVDLAGAVDAQGRRVWDWSQAVPSDKAVAVQASTLAGKWYATSFADASFAAPMDAAGATDGVYRRGENALELMGIASVERDRTLLVYDPPVVLYRLPMAPGDAWTSTGRVSQGRLNGLPYNGTDTYEARVDGSGRMRLPGYELAQVLRVRLRVTVSPSAGAPVERRQVSFVSECFGEVARATSALGETVDDFTSAAEVRRLGLE
jgi:hypothetical protein